MHKAQRLINHVALVLDASWSMKHLRQSVVRVADEQIKHLAKRSEELSQETRVSIYYFGETTIECLIFDMDVMRLPSIADLYDVLYENTSLIDATLKSQNDLKTTSQLYGDHAFLTFVLTDGQENRSRHAKTELANYIKAMEDNWSIGFLVPDRNGVDWMNKLGVLTESVAIWDTTSVAGLNAAASSIRSATDNFMTARAKGVRGTRSVFSTGADAVNTTTVQSNLNYLTGVKKYLVNEDSRIDDFVTEYHGYYNPGMAFYELTKSETIQPNKKILIVDKSNGNVYGGDSARQLIGLPNMSVRVRPDRNPRYNIFVQSTSLNRKLLAGTRVLVP